jgi:hypothetical protein
MGRAGMFVFGGDVGVDMVDVLSSTSSQEKKDVKSKLSIWKSGDQQTSLYILLPRSW